MAFNDFYWGKCVLVTGHTGFKGGWLGQLGADVHGVALEIIDKALREIDVATTEGRQRRKFLYAGDAARVLLTLGSRLLAEEETPSLLNAPASEPVAIVDLARALMATLGNPVELLVGALPQRKDERMEAWPDTSLAESLGLGLDWPIPKALTETVAWYEANR
jgi:nucleoside-diphosphate-sugar epimerase